MTNNQESESVKQPESDRTDKNQQGGVFFSILTAPTIAIPALWPKLDRLPSYPGARRNPLALRARGIPGNHRGNDRRGRNIRTNFSGVVSAK